MSEDSFKVDRSAFSVTSLNEQDAADKVYWLDKTPQERLAALELTRRIGSCRATSARF